MPFDLVNHVFLIPIVWSILAAAVLLMVDRSRNTSSHTLHLVMVTTCFGILLMPLIQHFIPRIYWSVLPFNSAEVGEALLRSDYFVACTTAYLTVVLGLWLHVLGQLVGLCALRRSGYSVTDSRHRKCLKDLADRLNVPEPQLIYIRSIGTPFTFGYRKPVIALPLSSQGWSDPMLRYFITHELAHIRRADWISIMTARLLVAIFWILPIAWTLLRKIRWHAELACDDIVLSEHNNRPLYARLLLGFSQGQDQARGMVALIEASTLFLRVQSVLDGGRVRQPNRRLNAVYFAGLVMLMVLLSSVELTPKAVQQEYRLLPLLLSHDPRLRNTFESPISEVSDKPFIIKEASGVDDMSIGQLETLLKIDPSPRVDVSLNYAMADGQEPVRPVDGNVIEAEELKPQATLSLSVDEPILAQRYLPKYPRLAIHKNWQGTVQVEFEVNTAGEVVNPIIANSSGFALLDRTALNAIKQYRYHPIGLGRTTNISQKMSEVFHFQLHEDAP